jgi:hypothetical protein
VTGTVLDQLRDLMVGVAVAARAGAPVPVLDQLRAACAVIPARGAA